MLHLKGIDTVRMLRVKHPPRLPAILESGTIHPAEMNLESEKFGVIATSQVFFDGSLGIHHRHMRQGE